MEINPYDLLFLLVFGSIAMNLLWRLLCYELRIHFADSYVVKIIYHDAYGKTDACYAIKSIDEDDACMRALQLFKKKNICFSHIDSINAVKISS